MTKAEAAAAWAEAKEALDAAHTAVTEARERFEAAQKTEGTAWEALQAMAGRQVMAGLSQESARALASFPDLQRELSEASARRTWQEQTIPIPPKVVG